MRLENPDGTLVQIGKDGQPASVSGTFTVERPPPESAVSEQLATLGLMLEDLEFEHTGTCRFVISIDGNDVKIVPFDIIGAGRPA